MAKFKLDNRGQAVVELALILPILLFLLIGIMEGGRLFAAYLELQHAARDGARYAAVHNADIKEDVIPWVEGRLVLLDPDKLELNFLKESTNDKKDVWVEISLNYPLAFMTPLIPTAFSFALQSDTINLHSKMAMRVE